MCFNKEVSFLIFLFGFMTAVKMFVHSGTENIEQKRYLLSGILIFTISLMQLVEMFLWMYQTKSITNLMLGKLILLTLVVQIISYFSANIALNLLNSESSLYETIIVFFTLTLLATLGVVFSTDWSNAYSLKNNSTCRLNWGPFSKGNFNIYSTFFGLCYVLTMTLLAYENYNIKGLIVSAGALLLAIGYAFTHGNEFMFGSLWCNLAVILFILAGIFDWLP